MMAHDTMAFLPVCKADMEARGWDACDFVYVSGDAYVDHPSFGAAIITRLLEAEGFRVGFIAQPDWNDPASVTVLGEPRLGFLVSAGNMDSMVNHYTVNKKKRSNDAYSPGGQAGLRPNYAVNVYSNLIRRTYKRTPIILGGVEASLRRLGHYDYWSDKLKRSVLLDSGADILSYGMGEKSIVSIARALGAGVPVSRIHDVPGTVWRTKVADELPEGAIMLPSFEDLRADPLNYARSFMEQYANLDPFRGKCLVEPYERQGFVVQNPPAAPLTPTELDAVYELPYTRTYHPGYEASGGIPAIREIAFSLTSNRGCYGECAFCALAFHQGRIVQSRTTESLLREAEALTHEPGFKGYINDVGGPTANFYAPACAKQMRAGACKGKRCLSPEPCRNLVADHSGYIDLLKRMRAIPGIRKVFVRSGIRFDYVMYDAVHGDEFMRELCEHHVSGQLRVAPEHVSDAVLRVMGKPSNDVYERFVEKFKRVNARLGKEQYVVPYLMSSHPGSTIREAIELAEYCRDLGYMPEQVQDFYPTPSTISTCMYYTGVDPRTMQPVYVPKDPHMKAMQRALIQYRDPANWDLVAEALRLGKRTDLIGYDAYCLIRPTRPAGAGSGSHRPGPKGAAKGSAYGSAKGGGKARTATAAPGRVGKGSPKAGGVRPASSGGASASKRDGGTRGGGPKRGR